MKKALSISGLALRAAFFLLSVLCFSAGAAAQDSYNWKTPPNALTALETDMVLQKDKAMNGLTQVDRDNGLAHMYYYRAIHARLTEGSTVVQAVLSSLGVFRVGGSGLSSDADASAMTITKPYRDILYQDAVTLLTD